MPARDSAPLDTPVFARLRRVPNYDQGLTVSGSILERERVSISERYNMKTRLPCTSSSVLSGLLPSEAHVLSERTSTATGRTTTIHE